MPPPDRWQILVPHRTRDEPLVAAASHCRDLPDGRIHREILIGLSVDGIETAGEAIDHLAGLDRTARRQLIDAARERLGLEPTGDVDEREAFAAFQASRVQAVELVACAHPGCTTSPARYGVPYAPRVRRWWCPAHEALAQPGDMDDPGLGIRLSPSGVPIPIDPADDLREATAREFNRRQQQARDDERAAAVAAHNEHEAARREQLERALAVRP